MSNDRSYHAISDIDGRTIETGPANQSGFRTVLHEVGHNPMVIEQYASIDKAREGHRQIVELSMAMPEALFREMIDSRVPDTPQPLTREHAAKIDRERAERILDRGMGGRGR